MVTSPAHSVVVSHTAIGYDIQREHRKDQTEKTTSHHSNIFLLCIFLFVFPIIRVQKKSKNSLSIPFPIALKFIPAKNKKVANVAVGLWVLTLSWDYARRRNAGYGAGKCPKGGVPVGRQHRSCIVCAQESLLVCLSVEDGRRLCSLSRAGV